MTRFLPRVSALLLLLAVGACATGPIPGGVPSPEEIPDLEQSLSEAPGERTTILRLGAAYLEGDRPADALALLEGPSADDDVALFLKAGALEALEEWERARTAYDRVRAESDRSDLVTASTERAAWVRRQQLRSDVAMSLDREAELADQAPDGASVAVFPFVWEGAETEFTPLSRALAEMLVTDLGQVEGIQVLERLRIQMLLDEIALSDADRVDPATAVRSGRILGAGRIVQGRMGGGEELISVLAGLVDATDETSVAEVDDGDAVAAFFDLQARIALGILQEMGIQVSDEDRERILLPPTTSLEALLLWGRALEAQDDGDFAGAAALFQAAAAEDPEFQDAADRAVESEQLERQAAVNPRTFGSGVVGGLPDDPLGSRADPDRVRIAYQPIEGLIPGPDVRDPGPELLGNEGIGSGTTLLDIILRLPR
ncbi:MAG: hypothetical protein EA352_10730 [Gemmatimonadales bacterium]|nr:MAG: hypothetical protein EA352_10730 [Gemmatimonadales bacterium]